MSVHVISWVLKQSDEEVAGRRLVLLVLADKADDDGTKAYPSVQTIAREARMSERGVRYALRELEKVGRIERLGIHPQAGTYEYRVVMREGGQGLPPGNGRREEGQSTTESLSQIAPEPSNRTVQDPSASGTRASKRDETVHALPDDLPVELHEVAKQAGRVLHRAAVARGQQRVVLLEAVGRAVGSHPTKDHVAVAERIEHWVCWGNGQGKPCRDIVARFRDWLGDSPDVRLPNGAAIAAPGALPAGVSRLSPKQERDNYRTRSLMEMGGLLPPGESV